MSSFVLIAPDELKVPSYIREDVLRAHNVEFKEVGSLEAALPELDILYMTRVQKERFFNEEDYIRLKDSYILDKAKMKLAKENMFVLHPLPRVNEISTEVDSDPRAAYFKQVQLRDVCTDGIDHDFTGGRKTMLNISGLQEGVVLDHIQAGKSLDIYYHLGLDKLRLPGGDHQERPQQ